MATIQWNVTHHVDDPDSHHATVGDRWTLQVIEWFDGFEASLWYFGSLILAEPGFETAEHARTAAENALAEIEEPMFHAAVRIHTR